MSTKPTYMRYKRVREILEAEPTLARKLGQMTVPVAKLGTSETELFSPEVIAITNEIHARGLDSNALSFIEVRSVAIELLINQPDCRQIGAKPFSRRGQPITKHKMTLLETLEVEAKKLMSQREKLDAQLLEFHAAIKSIRGVQNARMGRDIVVPKKVDIDLVVPKKVDIDLKTAHSELLRAMDAVLKEQTPRFTADYLLREAFKQRITDRALTGRAGAVISIYSRRGLIEPTGKKLNRHTLWRRKESKQVE
jgi:hypothetical protein